METRVKEGMGFAVVHVVLCLLVFGSALEQPLGFVAFGKSATFAFNKAASQVSSSLRIVGSSTQPGCKYGVSLCRAYPGLLGSPANSFLRRENGCDVVLENAPADGVERNVTTQASASGDYSVNVLLSGASAALSLCNVTVISITGVCANADQFGPGCTSSAVLQQPLVGVVVGAGAMALWYVRCLAPMFSSEPPRAGRIPFHRKGRLAR